MQKDNSTLRQKVTLRRSLRASLPDAVVMETHGGWGKIGDLAYADVLAGVVFEQKSDKAAILARKRPTWAVYEADCVKALAGGAGNHLAVNFVDIDPYGEPWTVVDALFGSQREWPATLGVAINDGLRQKLKMNGGWNVASMQEVVGRYGNEHLYKKYLAVCQELLQQKAGQVGYTLTRWAGYYCGHAGQMTHYAALLTR